MGCTQVLFSPPFCKGYCFVIQSELLTCIKLQLCLELIESQVCLVFVLDSRRLGTTSHAVLAHVKMSFLQAGVHLAFLSARPESVRGLTEAESFKNIFNPLLKRGELYCSPVLLLGSIHSGPTALLRFMLGNR